MDEYSNRRVDNEHTESKRASTLLSKRTTRRVTQTAQLRCTNRQNAAACSQVMCSENHNASKHSLEFAESKRVAGDRGSSSTNSSTRRLWEPLRKPIPPRVEKVLPENASISSNADGSIPPCLEVAGDIPLLENHERGRVSGKQVAQTILPSLNIRTENNLNGKQVLTDLSGSSSSSTKFKISQTTLPRLSHSSNKYVTKGSKCNFDVDSRVHKRLGLLEKGYVDGESSSSRMKKNRPVKIGETSGSAHGKSVEKLRKHLYKTRSVLESTSASAGTQRSAVSIRETKSSKKEYGNNTLLEESNLIIQGQDFNRHEVAVSISDSDSSTLQSNSSENSMYQPVTDGNSNISLDFTVANGLINQGAFPRQIESITEILLALEHIGQVQQMSHQRLLFLEMDSFLGSLSFYDQHREMRLDIDSMSYEELLALEDRIGCVSTAVPKEAMDRCLVKSFYEPKPYNNDADNLKCSICQEEYVLGDEVGRLHCEHLYHLCCIEQWLNQKNWCPICKASAVES